MIKNEWGQVDGEWKKDEMREEALSKCSGGWASQTGYRFSAAVVARKTLAPGVYKFEKTEQGLYFVNHKFPSDVSISLPGLPIDYILDQIKLFWSKADLYAQYGLVHKRGVLLYGRPGCGKTSIIKLLSEEIIKIGGIVFCITDFEAASEFIATFRRVEPSRPILTIQEDIEGLFEGAEGANQIKAALSFLDGQDQFNNIVHIATTNEPEKLKDRFIKRPGRFDLVIGMHAPEEAARRAYLLHVCKTAIPEDKLNEIVEKTKGLGLAYLRELASTYLCLDIPLDETLARLKENYKKKVLKNDDEKTGFEIGYSG